MFISITSRTDRVMTKTVFVLVFKFFVCLFLIVFVELICTPQGCKAAAAELCLTWGTGGYPDIGLGIFNAGPNVKPCCYSTAGGVYFNNNINGPRQCDSYPHICLKGKPTISTGLCPESPKPNITIPRTKGCVTTTTKPRSESSFSDLLRCVPRHSKFSVKTNGPLWH